jgi:hypothetical protein
MNNNEKFDKEMSYRVVVISFYTYVYVSPNKQIVKITLKSANSYVATKTKIKKPTLCK